MNNARFRLSVILTLLLGVLLFFGWRRAVHNKSPPARSGGQQTQLADRRDTDAPLDESERVKPPKTEELPPHVRLAAEELIKFAVAANLYNFNPQFVGFREDVLPRRKDVTNLVIQTTSHGASFINGRMDLVFSLYDGSDERRRPEVVKEWYKCTGKWTKEEAIQEGLAILQRLGDTETLQAVLPGKKEYTATEMGNVARTPDGQPTRVRPFHRVDLYDTNGARRVGIEFRMGATGVVGVTRFWRWP